MACQPYFNNFSTVCQTEEDLRNCLFSCESHFFLTVPTIHNIEILCYYVSRYNTKLIDSPTGDTYLALAFSSISLFFSSSSRCFLFSRSICLLSALCFSSSFCCSHSYQNCHIIITLLLTPSLITQGCEILYLHLGHGILLSNEDCLQKNCPTSRLRHTTPYRIQS